jgi:DNA-3-methyladenine glycosylase
LGNFKLKQSFFERDNTQEIAKELLGKIFVRVHNSGRIQAGIIVEDEVYHGYEDKASHASRSKTERNKVMFGGGGHYYVYFIYGMYWNLNVVTGKQNFPSAILIRALEPVFDSKIDLAKISIKEKRIMAAGPGRLCRWLEIDKSLYGKSVEDEELYLIEPEDLSKVIPELEINSQKEDIATDKRVGVDYAEEAADWDWRYYFKGNPYVSR